MVLKAHLDTASNVLDDRREPRRGMQLETSGTLSGGLEANVTIHNLSTSGLLLETSLPLEQGEVLEIDLPEVGPVDAVIVWHSEYLYGGAFAETLDAAALAAVQLQGGLIGTLGTPGPSVSYPDAPAQLSASPSESFGMRLNRLRRERSLTLAQIADALEVSKPTVWAWEKGKAKPLPERIEAIAEALGVETDELTASEASTEVAAITQDCRLRIATAYGTAPNNIRIMIEL